MRALIIHPSGKTELANIDGLDEMQAVVGGYVEAINFADSTMWCNEEGSDLELPVNPLASRFAKKRLAEVGRILLTQDGWIAGTVFLTGLVDDEGDETDVPQSVIAELSA